MMISNITFQIMNNRINYFNLKSSLYNLKNKLRLISNCKLHYYPVLGIEIQIHRVQNSNHHAKFSILNFKAQA